MGTIKTGDRRNEKDTVTSQGLSLFTQGLSKRNGTHKGDDLNEKGDHTWARRDELLLD